MGRPRAASRWPRRAPALPRAVPAAARSGGALARDPRRRPPRDDHAPARRAPRHRRHRQGPRRRLAARALTYEPFWAVSCGGDLRVGGTDGRDARRARRRIRSTAARSASFGSAAARSRRPASARASGAARTAASPTTSSTPRPASPPSAASSPSPRSRRRLRAPRRSRRRRCSPAPSARASCSTSFGGVIVDADGRAETSASSSRAGRAAAPAGHAPQPEAAAMTGPDPLDYGWWLASRSAGIVAYPRRQPVRARRAADGQQPPAPPRRQEAAARPPRVARRSPAWRRSPPHGLLLLGDGWLKPGSTGIAIPFTMDYRPGSRASGSSPAGRSRSSGRASTCAAASARGCGARCTAGRSPAGRSPWSTCSAPGRTPASGGFRRSSSSRRCRSPGCSRCGCSRRRQRRGRIDRRTDLRPRTRILDLRSESQQRDLVARASAELDRERQAVRVQACGHRRSGLADDVPRRRVGDLRRGAVEASRRCRGSSGPRSSAPGPGSSASARRRRRRRSGSRASANAASSRRAFSSLPSGTRPPSAAMRRVLRSRRSGRGSVRDVVAQAACR